MPSQTIWELIDGVVEEVAVCTVKGEIEAYMVGPERAQSTK